MSKILEFFGLPTHLQTNVDWSAVVGEQRCPYLQRTCLKTRKSEPDIAIGTCTLLYGRQKPTPVMICPFRLLERRQIFTDCIHLLSLHEPGNELHIVPQISIPGGSVDYFLVSARMGKVVDFVGIELQTLDTTGTVWPERQRFLEAQGVPTNDEDKTLSKSFGMNWKMTAKTTLIQLHHKIPTFEQMGKHLVLVLQDVFLGYMRNEFQFSHLNTARIGDPMHIHAYGIHSTADSPFRIRLGERLSTDTAGVARCLGLQAETDVELQEIVQLLEAKLSDNTLLTL
ncbi:MAG: hypothetical protein DWI57_10885 [Chloroflexi bacterium]|nr:MAG: hypothetical protein DWI57_10885 [Chloroflexota bacterium]